MGIEYHVVLLWPDEALASETNAAIIAAVERMDDGFFVDGSPFYVFQNVYPGGAEADTSVPNVCSEKVKKMSRDFPGVLFRMFASEDVEHTDTIEFFRNGASYVTDVIRALPEFNPDLLAGTNNML